MRKAEHEEDCGDEVEIVRFVRSRQLDRMERLLQDIDRDVDLLNRPELSPVMIGPFSEQEGFETMPQSITITDSQQFEVQYPAPTEQLKDRIGNPAINPDGSPALAGDITLVSDDTTKVTVGPNAAGTPNGFLVKAVEAPDDLGSVQCAASNGTLSDAINVTVTAQGAAGFSGTLGAPTEQP